MRNTFIVVVFVIVMVIVSVFGCRERIIEERQINNVVRVFWHENEKYSVHVREGGSPDIRLVTLPQYMCVSAKPRLLADVSPKDRMWVRYILITNGLAPDCLKVLEIHIRSEADIEGGGWNHGKFGSGQISVIQ